MFESVEIMDLSLNLAGRHDMLYFTDGASTAPGRVHPLKMVKGVACKTAELAPLLEDGDSLDGFSIGGVINKKAARDAGKRVHLLSTGSPTFAGSLASTRWASVAKRLGIVDLTGMDQPAPKGSTAEARVLPEFFVYGTGLVEAFVWHYNCMGFGSAEVLRGQTYDTITDWQYTGEVTSDGTRILVPAKYPRPVHETLSHIDNPQLERALGKFVSHFMAA